MVKCEICGQEFEKSNNKQKYCSDSCKLIAKKRQDNHYYESITKPHIQENKPLVTAKCEYCGEEFVKHHGNQIYCSYICAYYKKLEQNADSRMKSYHKNKKRGGDKFWGLGTGGLGPHHHEDWDVEFQKITNEMARLRLPSK